MKRIYLNCLAILVIAATLMAAFSGCAISKESGSSMDDLYAAVSWYEDVLESAEKEKSEDERKGEFVIVIPAGCGAELFYGADFLSREMSKYVAYDIDVVYDSEYKGTDDDIEILVGATSRRESIKYLKSLRARDYGYGYIDGSVVIGAHSDALCVEAINAFVSALSSDTVDVFGISDLDSFEKREEYGIEEITLLGFPIYEYDIVYPKENSMSERELANILKDKISEYSGYSLRVISDKQITDATRAISVGKTSLSSASVAQNKAVISVDVNKNIEIVSDKNAGIHFAVEEFVDIIKQSESDGKCNVSFANSKNYTYNGESISIYIMKDYFETQSIEELISVMNGAKESSLAIFQGLSGPVQTELYNNLGIKALGENRFYCVDGTNERCIFAESERVGGVELLTFVIERSDGKQFAVIGASCNGGAATDENFLGRLTEKCQKYADMPLVVLHDMSEDLDASFAEANTHLESALDTYGVYFSRGSLAFESALQAAVLDTVSADILKLDFYYS